MNENLANHSYKINPPFSLLSILLLQINHVELSVAFSRLSYVTATYLSSKFVLGLDMVVRRGDKYSYTLTAWICSKYRAEHLSFIMNSGIIATLVSWPGTPERP
jgi:hypothetical protein